MPILSAKTAQQTLRQSPMAGKNNKTKFNKKSVVMQTSLQGTTGIMYKVAAQKEKKKLEPLLTGYSNYQMLQEEFADDYSSYN